MNATFTIAFSAVHFSISNENQQCHKYISTLYWHTIPCRHCLHYPGCIAHLEGPYALAWLMQRHPWPLLYSVKYSKMGFHMGFHNSHAALSHFWNAIFLVETQLVCSTSKQNQEVLFEWHSNILSVACWGWGKVISLPNPDLQCYPVSHWVLDSAVNKDYQHREEYRFGRGGM